MKRLTFPLLMSAALALAACREAPLDDAAAPPPDPVVQGRQLHFPAGHPQLAGLGIVEAAAARDSTVELPARFVWNEDRTQRIYASFAGRVERIAADLGQVVKPGTPLAMLASPDFGAAQAETAKAQADANLTQKALARQRELHEAGVIARKDLDQAEADAARARAEVQRAEARTRLYGGRAGGVDQRLALVSGINGVVVERNLTPSQELRPDQAGPGVPPLFVVSDPTSLWVVIDARDSEAALLQPGAAFELVVPSLPGQSFQGKVTAAGDFIDPSTRTVRVRGVVANPQRLLKAEMLATARVQRKAPPGVVVPTQAVKLEGTQHEVMVQVAPGVFESRPVTLGYQSQGESLVTEGLKPGDKVVSGNMLMLSRQYRLALESAHTGAAQ